ncbi:hypothetical protein BGW42_001250 [Actinomortierella wolfii]|nr:hypothetical protein BGW42_001250 [Actinomortierella wolfii]
MDKPQEHDVRDMSLDEASIVEFDTIELEKENIQPIKSGRSAQALNHLFATSHADRANELALGHAKFQAELDSLDDSHKKKKNNNASTESGNDSGDNNNNNNDDDDNANDPLDVYVRYVKWVIENYPQGGQNPESGLLPLLDRAIRRFKDDDLYKNDPRLYKLFSTYTAMVEDPLDVLKFMLANEIATQVAMYYEDYSDYLERGGELTKALEIVQLGIHRGAQPLQQLKRRLEDLQGRIEEQRLLDQLQQEESSLSLPAVGTSGTSGNTSASSRRPLEQGRRILGVKDSTSATSSVHANSTPQGHRPIGNSVSSRSTYISSSISSSTSSSSSSNRKPNSTKLAVFVDPTGEKGERAAAKLATTAGPSAWRDIGSQQVRRKENIQDPIPWKGVQYHQSSSAPTKAPIAKLKVYRDNDMDLNGQRYVFTH